MEFALLLVSGCSVISPEENSASPGFGCTLLHNTVIVEATIPVLNRVRIQGLFAIERIKPLILGIVNKSVCISFLAAIQNLFNMAFTRWRLLNKQLSLKVAELVAFWLKVLMHYAF